MAAITYPPDVGDYPLSPGISGGGGTSDHRALSHRTDANQHPATAISVDTDDFVNSTADQAQQVLADLDAAIGAGGGAFSETIGNGADTDIEITHDLGTHDLLYSVRDLADNSFVLVPADNDASPDRLTLHFETAPTTDQFRVTVVTRGTGASGTVGATLLGNWFVQGDVATQTGLMKARIPFPFTIIFATLACGAGPTGDDLVLDVNVNGTTAATSKPTIADGDDGVTHNNFSSPDGDADDMITVDVDQIGSDTPGSNLAIEVWGLPR